MTPLSDLTINLDVKRRPVKESERIRGQYPYYGASGIVDFVDSYIFDGEHLLIAEDGENLRTRQTPYVFRATGKFWVNNHAHVLTGNHRALTRYLEYALLATDIGGFLSGAVMPKLTQANLNKIEVPEPTLPEQRSIVGALGSLDDRIELLRETNATLEGIAQALFKSWFVDFDPVHAKSEGRTPEGMDAATAALFPDTFQDSPLGPIPTGWTVRRVEELMTLAYGKALKAPDRRPGEVPVYGSGGVIGLHDAPLISGPGVIVGRKGTVGSVYWEDRDFFPIDTVFFVEAHSPLAFCHHVLSGLGLEEMNTDGAVPGLSRSNVYRLQVAVARDEILASFQDVAMTVRGSISKNSESALTLGKIRDELLPRLISGRLRLTEPNSMAGEHDE
jgi:type I restriction enzyme, S subunit